MAVSDFLCACFNWPLCATEGMPTGTEFITEPCASVVCKLGMYFRGTSQAVSLLSFVLIAGDKYTVPTVFITKILMFSRKNILLASVSFDLDDTICFWCAVPPGHQTCVTGRTSIVQKFEGQITEHSLQRVRLRYLRHCPHLLRWWPCTRTQ